MDFDSDKTHLRLQIDANLTADELEALILDLSLRRAAMSPPVPMRAPRPGTADPDKRLLQNTDPSIDARRLTEGRVRFYLRHPGLGWLCTDFTAIQAMYLRDFFTLWHDNGGPDFIHEQKRDSDSPTH